MFGKSPSFVFLQERMESNILHIIRFMQNELLHSKFRPALLEYKIDKSEGEDRLIIDVNGRDKKSLRELSTELTFSRTRTVKNM